MLARSLLLLVVGCATAGAADPPGLGMPASIVVGCGNYKDTKEKAAKALLGAFDAELRRAEGGGGNAIARAGLVASLTDLRAKFEKDGSLPWTAAMRPATEEYLHSLAAAETRLTKAYNEHIDFALRTKDAATVKTLRESLAETVAPKPVAAWDHAVGDGRGSRIVFYSNGHIGGADAAATWRYARGTLTLRWPNPRAPGGAWVDVCRVSADGKTYSGNNQDRARISGRLLDK